MYMEEVAPDTRPNWIIANAVGEDEVTYNGKPTRYTILKKELAPNLPGFLGYPNGEHLFISEEVPKQFRNPQLIHEIIEFTELQGKKGRCVEALKRELVTVPEEQMTEYLKYRTDFFGRLVAHYKDSKDEDFKVEIAASLEYLKSLI